MTIAWLQRFLILGGLSFCGAVAAYLWPIQRGWAWVSLMMPIFIMPLVLGLQCVWAAWCNRVDAAPSASFSVWLRAWLAECAAAAHVIYWWQPFRHRAIADDLQPRLKRRGVILVHGFVCNRGFWIAWMTRLKAERRVFVAVDLEPAFGSISAYAPIIEAAIQQVEQATGLPPVIIGHSMGGLAIRAWAAQYIGKAGHMTRIHRIITLGTPHQGTAIAVASLGENGHQMCIGSDWLADNAQRLPVSFAQHCTCYFSHCDNIVFPSSTATLAGADNQHIAGHAHVQLAFSKEIQQACLTHLEN